MDDSRRKGQCESGGGKFGIGFLTAYFSIDALRCPRCATPMVVLALISDPPVITKILQHLRLPTEPPPLAPVRASWELQPPLVLTSPGNDPASGDPAIIASEEEILIPSPLATLSAARSPP
ncbi:MAG: hypothetical protein KAY24_06760 [Candidatus Eisenbacteria sp.]|nr:hypothetical protein [Candidatus Eisenbacteria bacterium]